MAAPSSASAADSAPPPPPPPALARDLLARACELFNLVTCGHVKVPAAEELPTLTRLVFLAPRTSSAAVTIAEVDSEVEAWTFPSLTHVYVHVESGLVAFLRHMARQNNTAVHFTVVCADGVTGHHPSPGARLRFLACMHNLRMSTPEPYHLMKDMRDECYVSVVGNDAVVHTGMRLLLGMDQTEVTPRMTALPIGFRVYHAGREEFDVAFFCQLQSCMWTHAPLLEAAAAAADGIECDAAWVAASGTSRTLGDFMYQLALLADEASYAAARSTSSTSVSASVVTAPIMPIMPMMPMPRLTAVARAGMRCSQHLFEKLKRQNTTYGRIGGAAGDGFYESVTAAFSDAGWPLDVLLVLCGRLRLVLNPNLRSTHAWDAEAVWTVDDISGEVELPEPSRGRGDSDHDDDVDRHPFRRRVRRVPAGGQRVFLYDVYDDITAMCACVTPLHRDLTSASFPVDRRAVLLGSAPACTVKRLLQVFTHGQLSVTAEDDSHRREKVAATISALQTLRDLFCA